MNNPKEGGRRLEIIKPTGGEIVAAVAGLAVVGGILVAAAKSESSYQERANAFVPPQGATEVLNRGMHSPILVYEGQQRFDCPPGGVDKVEILRDGNNEFRGINVKCKPEVAQTPTKQPAK